ncbi:MAG TPA: glycoside hydrolase family 2 TIM barrel-domain containing protein [Bryobacteraceae bacterium]|nr:glycoside hydrolase family 2 TIM barrel-domain containing protein [Bryobacteraceae bacterium]
MVTRLFMLAAVCGAALPMWPAEAVRERRNFDADWRFHLGDVPGGERERLDDSAWRTLSLPHDWSIEGPYSAANASGTGYLPGGIGWYRKVFRLPDLAPGRRVFLAFDGVYRDSDVWINGHHLGHRPYGYSSFEYELTPHLHPGSEANVVAVRVDHSIVADSRWYTGSGIYRHVWLNITQPVHVAHWGTYIYTPVVHDTEALASAETSVVNSSEAATQIKLVTAIEEAGGREIVSVASDANVAPGASHLFAQQAVVPNPRLWSLASPNLYTVVSRVYVNSALFDEYRTPFGIRTIRFDPNTGFYLNGKPEKLKGVCLHHDLGALGSAFSEAALERRLKLLKEIGVNAIRCSHNPMAPEEYDLCDRLGLLVMDEAFDEWAAGKKKWIEGRNVGTPGLHGYSDAFAEWSTHDIEDMVLRDRNHPSVILWSIGNEIDYPNDPYGHPRGRGGLRPGVPSADALPPIARGLISAVKRLDGTRPVTQALADTAASNATGLADLLDVVGYNYLEADYARDHQAYAERVILGSENSHSLAAWQTVARNAWVAGQFLWTGVDYLGESNRYPDRGSSAGLLDYCGFRKPESYLREALWSSHGVIYAAAREAAPAGGRGGRLVEHWNWSADARKTIPVDVYTNYHSAELFLNGRSLGAKQIPSPFEPVLRWDVPNEPGVVRVVGFSEDSKQEAGRFELVTAGPAHHLELLPDKTALAGREDLSQIEVRVVDANGRRAFGANDEIEAQVTGAGELAAMDNADPRDVSPVRMNRRKAYQGRVLAIVRASTTAGRVIVRASAPGLQPAEVTLTVGSRGQ